MNPSQFATLAEAQAIAKKLGTVGGGVKPYNADDNDASGIYIPSYFGPFPAPSIGDAKFYHFRFENGAEGFNVGLIRTFMQVFPATWILMIMPQINSAAAQTQA